MSQGAGIIPDESVFADLRRQCTSTENWQNKYNKNGMEVWVEVPSSNSPQVNKGSVAKVHKIKVNLFVVLNVFVTGSMIQSYFL